MEWMERMNQNERTEMNGMEWIENKEWNEMKLGMN